MNREIKIVHENHQKRSVIQTELFRRITELALREYKWEERKECMYLILYTVK